MHRLKASDIWRMTFADLGDWMLGIGSGKWCVLGLSGKVKKKTIPRIYQPNNPGDYGHNHLPRDRD